MLFESLIEILTEIERRLHYIDIYDDDQTIHYRIAHNEWRWKDDLKHFQYDDSKFILVYVETSALNVVFIWFI